mgnify:CR=1 FL=1|tara:strand:+ start:246 stop:455 length:210 start_codon:yes stop_codon:yes gene_type:complete
MSKQTVRGQPGKYVIKATKVAKPKLPEDYHIPLDADNLIIQADQYEAERRIINEINHYEFKEQLENNKE